PGRKLDRTPVGGNRLLEHVFDRLHTGRRHTIPPFLAFESLKAADGKSYMKFLGLACPGAPGISALEDLVAVWRVKGTDRFQNYRSTFTVLKEETVPSTWL